MELIKIYKRGNAVVEKVIKWIFVLAIIAVVGYAARAIIIKAGG